MLGEPETSEAPPFGVLCQIEGIVERFCDGAALPDGSKIENREARNGPTAIFQSAYSIETGIREHQYLIRNTTCSSYRRY
jgi:hypothetical protein